MSNKLTFGVIQKYLAEITMFNIAVSMTGLKEAVGSSTTYSYGREDIERAVRSVDRAWQGISKASSVENFSETEKKNLAYLIDNARQQLTKSLSTLKKIKCTNQAEIIIYVKDSEQNLEMLEKVIKGEITIEDLK